jgi:large subunit ribosomal protein L21
MYVVVRSGGKQLRMSPGQEVRVERLPGSVGETVELGEVMLVGGDGPARVGTPLVAGARVIATITRHGRAEKVGTFKLKRRKGHRKRAGHRQGYTALRVERIEA